MDELSKEIASLPSDVLSKAYDDALHPVLSSVGDTLSLVPRTVGVLLGPWKKWVVNGESNIEEAIRQIEEKMEDVPEDCFCEPAQNVVVPAIQQLSYSYDSQDLRGLYVNLLASSMDKRVSPLVHPSFVSIIGQLTPDEAKMMSWLSEGLGKDHIPLLTYALSKTMTCQLKLGGECFAKIIRTYSMLSFNVLRMCLCI